MQHCNVEIDARNWPSWELKGVNLKIRRNKMHMRHGGGEIDNISITVSMDEIHYVHKICLVYDK